MNGEGETDEDGVWASFFFPNLPIFFGIFQKRATEGPPLPAVLGVINQCLLPISSGALKEAARSQPPLPSFPPSRHSRMWRGHSSSEGGGCEGEAERGKKNPLKKLSKVRGGGFF